jgi:hypothetical protein
VSKSTRIIIRAVAIGLQWLALTVALGSLVMRSDQSYEQLISPHFGALPVFLGAIVAGFLLGLTVESPRYLAPLVILMTLGAAMFVGVLAYAPVVDGLLLRTAALDNYVAQRAILMWLILLIVSVPAAVGGNLLGANLKTSQEIAPHPEDLRDSQEVPWWDQRRKSNSDPETNHHPVS